MNFFCKKKDYDEYVANMQLSEDDMFCLNAAEALQVARMLFFVTDI
ncbi:hypothetical protein KQI88_06215 [Alkaliphilus sp. MSJ-5]|uniref:Uncharacterized protein n=3 Tax=Alkaliphilus flagellatus TaxID=2841507 RepID=A0ABS6G0X9_9FIRM|nr:hypothetical protein [Alkaliphilus flagellatus]